MMGELTIEILKLAVMAGAGFMAKIIYDVIKRTYRNGNGERRSDYSEINRKLDVMAKDLRDVSISIAEVKTTVEMQRGQISEIFTRLRDLGG